MGGYVWQQCCLLLLIHGHDESRRASRGRVLCVHTPGGGRMRPTRDKVLPDRVTRPPPAQLLHARWREDWSLPRPGNQLSLDSALRRHRPSQAGSPHINRVEAARRWE